MENNLNENDSSIPYIMPMFNSEEKIDEVNRLLEILAKRKKYSIVVTMLLVFQKFNYQKLMKEYLFNGVKQIIIENPLRVVSYHGVPFTTKNFIRGMRVEYGKHKLFNKEMIDGIEYYYTNIVYTCIYLSDEIAKICKGAKNLKTVHYSLIDDIELEGNPTNVPSNGNNNYNNDSFLNGKRNRSVNSENPDDDNSKSRDMSEGTGTIKDTLRKRKYGQNEQNGIINLQDSDESDEEKKEKEKEKTKPNISTNNNNNRNEKADNNNFNNININKTKGDNSEINKNPVISEKLNYKQIKKNTLIHYQSDLNSLKYTINDILNLFDYSSTSPLYQYLKDNSENIDKLKEVFLLFQEMGSKGENYLEDLYKIIPEEFNQEKKDEENKDENGEIQITKIENENNLTIDKEMQKKIEHISELYKTYDDKKRYLLYLYQIIQSTVKNIRHLGSNPDINLIKNDLAYIDINEKKFESLAEEMFPLLDKIYKYFDEQFDVKNLAYNLQIISSELTKNDLNFKTFLNFSQNLAVLLPNSEHRNGKNIFDCYMREDLSYEERAKQFKNIVLQEKNLLLKYIGPLRKYFSDENNFKNKDESTADNDKTDSND